MIIHWRGSLNAVQNAIAYGIKPWFNVFYSGEQAAIILYEVNLETVSVSQPMIGISTTQPTIGITVKNDIR